MTTLCFLDFETTGPDPATDHPLQLGASLVDDATFVEIRSYVSYVRPPVGVGSTERALRIHGITGDMVGEAPSPVDVLGGFYSVLGEAPPRLVGWNVCFDVSVLRRVSYEHGHRADFGRLPYRHIDVQSIAHAAQVAKRITFDGSLTGAAAVLGLSRSARHDALEDARLTASVYRALILMFGR